MDFPKSPTSTSTTVTATPAASNINAAVLSSPVQESPFLNFLTNLSPIMPVELAHGGASSFSLSAELPKTDDGSKKLDKEESGTFQSIINIPDSPGGNDIIRNTPQDQLGICSDWVNDLLNVSDDVDCANSAKNIQEEIDYRKNEAVTGIADIQDLAEHETEAGQLQRGLSRRCLRFDEHPMETTLGSFNSADLTENIYGSGFSESTTLENLDSSHQDLTAYSNVQMSGLEPSTSPQLGGKSPIVLIKPAGLHLNSAVNTLPMPHDAMGSIKSTQIMENNQEDDEIRILEPRSLPTEPTPSPSVHFSGKSLNEFMTKSTGFGLHLNSFVNATPMPRDAMGSLRSTEIMENNQDDEARVFETRKSTVIQIKPDGLNVKTVVNPLPMPHNDLGSIESTQIMENNQDDEVRVLETQNSQNLQTGPAPSTFPHFSGKSTEVMTKSGGFGLHLNSLVAMPHDAMGSIKSTKIISSNQDDEDRILETQTSPKTSANQLVHSAEVPDNFQKALSPRRNEPSSIDGVGPRHCNCNKSNCLKRYCHCFASGSYCNEHCACKGCINKPEYKDTVLEIKQSIESYVPHAFAPKGVQKVTSSAPASQGDQSRSIQSSSRHERGCSCEKSMCQKKYCVCYQIKVGCSSKCRCKVCKNVYGRKEENDRSIQSSPRHEKGCACKKDMCLENNCSCYQSKVGCSSECRCEGCENVYGEKKEYGVTEEILTDRVSQGRLESGVDDKLAATDEDSLQAGFHEEGSPKSPLILEASAEPDSSVLPSNANFITPRGSAHLSSGSLLDSGSSGSGIRRFIRGRKLMTGRKFTLKSSVSSTATESEDMTKDKSQQ